MINPFLLRHGTVEKPFNDYNKVKFEEFINFASGKIDPGVDIQTTEKEIENTIQNNPEIKNTDILISSPMKRCIETCKIIRNKINKDIPIIQFQELVEVFRKPQNFSDSQGYYKDWVYQYRDNLITDMYENRYSDTENIQYIYTRLINIFSYIYKNYLDEKLTIVSHVYPLKYTDFFVNNQISYWNFSLQDMLDNKPKIKKWNVLPLKYNLREYVENEIIINHNLFQYKAKIHELQIQR